MPPTMSAAAASCRLYAPPWPLTCSVLYVIPYVVLLVLNRNWTSRGIEQPAAFCVGTTAEYRNGFGSDYSALLLEVVDVIPEVAVPQPPQDKPDVGPPRIILWIGFGARPPARVEPPGVPRVHVQHPIRKYLIPMLLSEVPECRRWRFDPFQVRRAVRVTVYTKMAVDITGFADPNAEIEILQRRQVVAANLVFRSHLVKLRDAGETEEVEAERGIGMQQNYGRG